MSALRSRARGIGMTDVEVDRIIRQLDPEARMPALRLVTVGLSVEQSIRIIGELHAMNPVHFDQAVHALFRLVACGYLGPGVLFRGRE